MYSLILHRFIYYLENNLMYRDAIKNFKAMDALQIATAVVSKCDMFFTNDKQLRHEKGRHPITENVNTAQCREAKWILSLPKVRGGLIFLLLEIDLYCNEILQYSERLQ